MRIYLIGLPGCGKTTLGKSLAKQLDYSFVDLDLRIEQHEHQTISSIFSTKGEAYFRELESSILHNTIHDTNAIIATGGGAPCFHDNMSFMKSQGLTVFIHVSPNEIYRRLEASEGTIDRPLLKGKTDMHLLQDLIDKLENRLPFYSQADLVLENDALQASDLIQAIQPYLL